MMTEFIKNYMPLLVILAIPTCTLFVLIVSGLVGFFVMRTKLSNFIQITIIATITLSFVIFIYGTAKLHDHLNYGQITEIFILKSAGETRVLVWTEMEDLGGGMGTVYANRFKLYDFMTGKLIHQAFLNRRADFNDYSIYGPFPDGRAWSYSRQTGLSLLDLYEGRIIMNEKQILKRLPRLGKTIRIFSGDEYNSRTDAIYVTTPDGKVHQILPNDLGKLNRKVYWLDTNKYKNKLKLPSDLAEQLR